MSPLVQLSWVRSSQALVFLGVGVFLASPAVADDGAVANTSQGPRLRSRCLLHDHDSRDGSARGGAPFQGFGLGYHLGYGYGGAAIGVGPDGGYPFYGGPGYPHPAPCLRRCGGITPYTLVSSFRALVQQRIYLPRSISPCTRSGSSG